MLKRVAGAVLFATIALWVAACGGGGLDRRGEQSDATDTATHDTTTTTPPATEPAPTAAPIEWEGCGGGLECAELDVPLDYSNPTGDTITLALNRRAARDAERRIGPLLLNPGGPGGSGIDLVASFPFSNELRDHFDIIGFDPRGVGKSSQVRCGDDDLVEPFRQLDSGPDTPDEQSELDAAAKAIADDCAQRAGDVLPFLGTDDVVRDMDTIRSALGEAQISFLGFSYGTLLGERYLELFPANARAVVLDGVVDPTQDFVGFLTNQTQAFEKAANDMFDDCPDGGRNCPEGGAAAAYDKLAAQVETDPLPTDYDHDLGPGELPIAAIYATYGAGLAPELYAALEEGLDGDGTRLLEMALAYEDFGHFGSYAAVECIDSPHPVGSAEFASFSDQLEAISPRFGASIANELLSCAYWPAPVKDITGPVDGEGGPPVLVIGNTGDAATPYHQAQKVAESLANGVLLTFDSTGHTAYGGNNCIDGYVDAYLVDLELPPEGTVCD